MHSFLSMFPVTVLIVGALGTVAVIPVYFIVLLYYKKYQVYIVSQAIVAVLFVASRFVFFRIGFPITFLLLFTAVALLIVNTVILLKKNTYVLSSFQRRNVLILQAVFISIFLLWYLIYGVYINGAEGCAESNKRAAMIYERFGLDVAFCDSGSLPIEEQKPR